MAYRNKNKIREVNKKWSTDITNNFITRAIYNLSSNIYCYIFKMKGCVFLKIINKRKIKILELLAILFLNNKIVNASSVGTEQVATATENLQRVITSLAIPLGSVIIFASIVITALKMIFNANNPQKRGETIGSLAWIVGGGVLLGLSLVVAGIILNIATNGTGQLI